MQLKYVQILVLGCVFALQFLVEHMYPQKKEINNWKNERFNLAVGLLNVVLTFLPASLLVQWLHYIEQQKFGALQQIALPFSLQLLATFLVMDLWMYAWHRLNHQVPFLWRLHRFHHRDEKMNSTTAVRFHIAELFLSYPGKALVCLLFGISYLPLVIYEIAFFASVIVHHSNMYITPKADAVYRTLFASPLMHRIHHSNKRKETNSNYGALFSFWDRLFGSWTEKPKEEVVFGLPKD